MRIRSLFQNSKHLRLVEKDIGPAPAESAHHTEKARLTLPGSRIKERLVFIKRAANQVENDLEIALSALSQLDGPYFAETVGLAVSPAKTNEARSAAVSIALNKFCSYRDLMSSTHEEKQKEFLHCDKQGHPIAFKKVKGLASLMCEAYRDGEDDLHRQNFGVFQNEQGEFVWGRIDFGLGFAETTKIAPRLVRTKGLSFIHEAYSLIRLQDLEHFPLLKHSVLFYWPTRISRANSKYNPNAENRYLEQDKRLFSSLLKNKEFIKEKHEFFLKQLMQPLSLKRRCILENVSSPEEALKLADAVEYRHFSFMISALALPAFRQYLSELSEEELRGKKDEVIASINGLELESDHNQLSEEYLRLVDENFQLFKTLAEKIDSMGIDDRITDQTFKLEASHIATSTSDDSDKQQAYCELFARFIKQQKSSPQNLQHVLDLICQCKANEIITRPYLELLEKLKHFSESDSSIEPLLVQLSAYRDAIITDLFSADKKENFKTHEVFLLQSQKANQIRRFSENLAYVLAKREECMQQSSLLNEERLAVINHALEKATKALSFPKCGIASGLECLSQAHKDLIWVPYELKRLEVREKFKDERVQRSTLPIRRIRKILFEEEEGKKSLPNIFYQHLERETKGNSQKSRAFPFLNHPESTSFDNVLNTCNNLLDEVMDESDEEENKSQTFSMLLREIKIKKRLKQAVLNEGNSAVYEVDCLLARLLLEVEIRNAKRRLQKGEIPQGLGKESFKRIIQAAEGVVKAVAKPTYHERDALANVAQAATLVTRCLKEPTLENALYCHNHIEALDLSKKTRAMTILSLGLSVLCLSICVGVLGAVGVMAISSGLGAVAGIMALSLAAKLTLAATATIGLGFGAHGAYRYLRDEDKMKRKLSFFSSSVLAAVSPDEEPIDNHLSGHALANGTGISGSGGSS